MNLDEFKRKIGDARGVTDEIDSCDFEEAEETEAEAELQEDLTDALEFLRRCHEAFNAIVVHRQRMVRFPVDIVELAEEVGEWLDQWNWADDPDSTIQTEVIDMRKILREDE